ncbi:MAG: hypothetical protein ACOCV1_00160 [Bacillota bacterium]
MIGITILIISFVLIICALSVWLLIIYNKEEKIGKNEPLVLNLIASEEDGRAMITEKEVQNGCGKRFVVNAEANDIDQNSKNINRELKIVVPENKVISLPQGLLSKDRNIKIYLPIRAENMPESIKNTDFGKSLMFLTELKDYKSSVEKILREGSKRKDNLLQEIGDGELSSEFLNSIKGLVIKDIKELIRDKKGNSSNITDLNSNQND